MVSVIIPTLNAGNKINKLLASIKSQTISCEIVVVDSSSTDDTTLICKSYGAMIISIKKEEFNHGGTRNLAVSQTKGDIIVFMTQDALPFDEECIEKLIKPLENADIAAAYGRHIPMDSAKPTERFARYFNYPDHSIIKGINDLEESGIKTFFFSNVFSAVKRKQFEETGKFSDQLIMFEDIIYAANLIFRGYKIAYTADAKVIHSHDFTFFEQFERYFEAGVSFKNNPLFLKYARTGGEGISLLKNQIRFLMENKYYIWIAYALIEALFKYSGYISGINYDKLPDCFTKKYCKNCVRMDL